MIKKYIKIATLLGIAAMAGGCGQFLDGNRTHTYDTLYVMNADGRNVLQISPDLDHHYGQANWSPDGTKIVYASSDLGDVFVSAVTGGDATNLTNTSSLAEHTPKWSPDGTRIAYYVRSGSRNDVYLRLADGSSPTFILENALPMA